MAGAAVDEQPGILEEAFGFVAEQRFYLRKAIQHNDMEMALRYGLCLANELRSSKLFPENYYKLYALVFWELQHLAAFVASTARHGLNIAEVYELVQHEGNVLPRLYMLVTVGAAQMQPDHGQVNDVLEDLSWMLGAVQHPVRGLFLRYFLLQMVKDKLFHLRGARGALQYLLTNLRESASLWARLRLEDCPRQGGAVEDLGLPQSSDSGAPLPAGETWRLDRNRHTLRLLVGAHIMHMARLQELSVELHSEVVLPEVLRLSTTCEDAAGQAYLLRCFVEVLPERFHLQTLERVLAACAQVHWGVNLQPLLQHLIRRLTAHVREGAATALGAAEAFNLFHAHLRRLHLRPRSSATPLASLLELQLELLTAGLALHPGDASRAELVLAGTVELLEERRGAEGGGELLDARAAGVLVDLLAVPLTQEPLVPAVLALPHHARLMAALGRGPAQREGALAMVAALLAGDVGLGDCGTLQRLLALVDPLVRDNEGDSGTAPRQPPLDHDPEAFTAEQEKVARLVHQVRHVDLDVVFRMLRVLRNCFEEGGPHRIVFTLPALVVAALRLMSGLLDRHRHGASEGSTFGSAGLPPKTTIDELLLFSHALCSRLSALAPEESLRLWLLCVSVIERAGCLGAPTQEQDLGTVCNSFLEGGLACLEDELRGSAAQFRGLQLLVGTLRQLTCLRGAPYERAAERAVQFGGRLATALLQCRALCLCAGLFWSPACKQPGRTLACLRRALRLADSAIHVDPMDVGLFVEVLDQAVHHFGQGNEEITAPFLSGLLALCVQHLRYIESRAPVEALRGLHVALADLQEKQAKALEEAPSSFEGMDAESSLVCATDDVASAVDVRYATLQLQVAAGVPGVPVPADVRA